MPLRIGALFLGVWTALAFVQAAGAQPTGDSLVTYRWIGDRAAGAAVGAAQTPFTSVEIDVPPGFTARHDWYGEGLLTVLRYPDSTLVTLHWGGMMSFSRFRRADAEVRPSPTGRGSVTFGESGGRAWGAYLYVYGIDPNVLFENAPLDRRAVFERALASVRVGGREPEGPPRPLQAPDPWKVDKP